MKKMALQNASQKGSRPVKVLLRRDHSIVAKRHLPRQLGKDSNIIFVGSRNKKGKFILISRPKVKPTHVLAKSSLTSSKPLKRASAPSEDAATTATPTSNKTDATSVTSLQSESISEQNSKQSASIVQSGTRSENEYDSDVSHSHPTVNPSTSEEKIIPTEISDRQIILKMGPQDVNVVEENEYLTELCREYKSRFKDDELAAKLIDWVHGKNGNFLIPKKGGVFAVASFPIVDAFLQRIIISASHKKIRPLMPLPMKSKGLKQNSSAAKSPTLRETIGGLTPQHADVICGRGNSAAFHPGNLSFRKHCWVLREKYRNMPRQEKRVIAQSVVDQVKAEGGRFLEIDNGIYVIASAARALEKASQALREKKWENRKSSLLGPDYSTTSPPKKEMKVQHDKASKKIKLKPPPKSLAPKKASSTAAAPSWPEQVLPQHSETESRNDEVEIGTRIEVYWPMDQKYYAAKVKAVNGDFVHLEYELDGVIEWLNLSEHTVRTIA